MQGVMIGEVMQRFNAVDESGEEVCISGSQQNAVLVQVLLNDTTVKSKGSGKAKRKMLTA